MKREEKILRVKMFGKFVVEGMGKTMDEDSVRSEMMSLLFAYLISHRQKEMSILDIGDALWEEDETDNPAGALKNLMYRLRTRIKKTWGDLPFIITGQGSYSWNPQILVELDAEEFEACCEAGDMAVDPAEKRKHYAHALALYKGQYLSKFSSEHWIISQTTYYHAKYLETAKKQLALLQNEEDYNQMTTLASAVLAIDPLDEGIQHYFIIALTKQGKTNLAIAQYKKAVNLLYEKLGVTPSDQLREAYEELLKQTHEQEMDLRTIEKELREEALQGAFLCEYGVFKKTYRLELRRATRLGISVYIALITILPDRQIPLDSPDYVKALKDGMDLVEEVLLNNLRSGDVISRYSSAQFIVLLPTCQYESAKMVMKRIEEAYLRQKKKPQGTLQFSLQEMGNGNN